MKANMKKVIFEYSQRLFGQIFRFFRNLTGRIIASKINCTKSRRISNWSKIANISKYSLGFLESIFRDMRPVNLPLGKPESFCGGFQMANMKKVTISEDALKRVQTVFADLGGFAPLDDASGFHKINMGAEKSVEKIEVSKEDGDTELGFLRNLDDETFDQMFGENAMFTQNLLNAIENPKIPEPIEEVSLAEDVRLGRESAGKLQEEFAVEKAKNYVEIFKSDFIEKKLTPSRRKLRDFVAGGYPGKFSKEELIGFGVKGATMSLNWKNCLEMEFDLCDFFEENELAVNIAGFSLDHFTVIPSLRNRLGFYEISRAFRASRGINPHAILEGWLENAWRFIVLKFAAMECAFPDHFAGQLLTPKNLLHQLHYRYFREIVLGQNSALKKIMELEESPKKTLVLFVLDVMDEGIVLLSDGWYKISGKLDAALAERLKLGKISVGTKLITQGCNLLNCDREYSPLKIPPNVMLELHGNSTRRCRWDTKLGFFARLRPKCVSLDSILYNGGLIPRIVVCFIRVYPAIYIESFRERRKRHIVRSERAEKRYCDRMSSKCFDNFENVYNKVQEEFLQQNNDRNISIRNITNISCIRDPEELNCLLKYSYDPESVENEMTGSQKEMVRQHLAKMQEKKYQEIAECVRKRLRQQKLERRVKKLLQIRVVDAKRPGKSVMLNFWLPSEEFSSVLKEGDIYELTSCTAREIRNGDIFVDGPRIEDGDQNVRKLGQQSFPSATS
uniref:Tower domain-containing protein n=1 Tax=Phlebotomus papatasi TaxID=29031 RepID=A0A1B0D5H3_PHLPP